MFFLFENSFLSKGGIDLTLYTYPVRPGPCSVYCFYPIQLFSVSKVIFLRLPLYILRILYTIITYIFDLCLSIVLMNITVCIYISLTCLALAICWLKSKSKSKSYILNIYKLLQLHSLHAYCQQKLLQVYNFRGKRLSLSLSISLTYCNSLSVSCVFCSLSRLGSLLLCVFYAVFVAFFCVIS